jgi:hypothetical protein
MDENENNETGPAQELPAADQDVMKSEGVEIVDLKETPADKDAALDTPIVTPPPVDAPAAPIPQSAPLEKTSGGFTLITKSQSRTDFIKPIRTYRSDAEEAVKRSHTSVIDIAVAESKKKQETPIEYAKEPKSRGLLWLSLVLVFIALAVGAATYYFWIVGSSAPATTSGGNYYSLISSQKIETLPIESKYPLQSVRAAIEGLNSLTVGSIVDLVPTNASGTAITLPTDFFSAIGIPLPAQMALSLDGTYMLGTIISDTNHPFIVLGLSSFENAFAGMLSWEKTMRQDFAGFIAIDHPNEPAVPLSPETFTDTTIDNQDVREILDASSTPLLLYAFVGTSKLVIATDPSALSAIITDINTTNTTR